MLVSRVLAVAVVVICLSSGGVRAQEETADGDGGRVDVALGDEARGPAALVSVAEAVTVIGDHPCLTADLLVAKVRSWLRRDEVDGALRIEVRGLEFEVIQDGEVVAVRSFDEVDRACEDVQAMMSLAVALAIDASILERFGAQPAEESEAPVGESDARALGEPEEQPTAASDVPSDGPVEAEGEEVALWLRLGGFATVDVVDGLGGGALLGLEAHFGLPSIRASVVGTVPVDVPVGGGQASTLLVFGRLDGCLLTQTQPAVGGCLGVGAGQAIASGEGFTESHSAGMWWAAALARAEARLALSEAWALELSVEALVPFVRPELTVDDVDGNVVATKSLPVAGGSVGAALVVRLW